MTRDNDNKVSETLATGLVIVAITVSIGLLYLLNVLVKQSTTTPTTQTLGKLKLQEPQQQSQLEKLYMQRLGAHINNENPSISTAINSTQIPSQL